MNDNDIIKALEHCASSKTSDACKGCPLLRDNGSCRDDGLLLYESALEIINHQKTEIGRLKSKVNRLEQYDKERDIRLHTRLTEAARVEAIKEFADRLCNGRVSNDPVVIAVKCTVKEMTEVHHAETD